MHSGNNKIALRQRRVIKIQRAVRQDVNFGAKKNPEILIRKFRVEFFYFDCLLPEPSFVETVGLALAFAVIGNADVFQTEVPRSVGHRFNTFDAVTPSRMNVEHAAKIFLHD